MGVLLVAAAACGLAGCAAEGPAGGQPSKELGSAPAFSGPWADDFTSAYRAASSDFEKKALADGKITDAEFSEVENTFKTCLKAKNVTFTGFKTGGGYDFHFGNGINADEANKAADDCSASSGLNTVGALYFRMQRNPNHLDEPTIMAACLVKKGAVPQGYSAADYLRNSPDQTYPFASKSSGEKVLRECGADPLGLLSAGN